MDERPKLQAWTMDEDSSAQGYKDIVPGDQVNQQAALNKAYNRMGDSMAKEKKEDQQYKDDTEKMLKETTFVQTGAVYGSSVVGVDKAVDGVVAYYVVKTIYWFSHPIPGLRQSKTATIIFSITSIIGTLIVIGMIVLGILGFILRSN